MDKKAYYKNFAFLITLLSILASCKTDLIVRPLHKSEHLSAIEKLPASDKIRQQEMTDWYLTHIPLNSGLSPDWNHPQQTIYNGNHVVEISYGPESAFFFTKVKGKLNIYIAAWQDKDPSAYVFIGNIAYYSFQDKKLTFTVYNKNGIVKSGVMKVPVNGQTEGELAVKIMSQEMWEYISGNRKIKSM